MPSLLSVQAFSVYGTGGGPRVLRSLLEDGVWPVVSVAATPEVPEARGSITEYHMQTRPAFARVSRTRLGGMLEAMTFAHMHRLRSQLQAVVGQEAITAIHSVAHGIDFLAAYAVARRTRRPFLLTIHDHPAYAFTTRLTRIPALRLLGDPWREADQRYVISAEMGEDLCRRYGRRAYSVVTDGVATVSRPRPRPALRRHVYCMGAFHISYRKNLRALVKGLALYSGQHGADVSVVLRGAGAMPEGLERGNVPIVALPWGSQEDIYRDLETSDLLYVPLPFGKAHEAFVRFSLSTKLVTFLASGLPILFHGPAESAAAHLLGENGAAILADSLEPQALAQTLEFDPGHGERVSAEAGRLADRRFRIEDQRQRFWGPVCGLQTVP